MEFGCVCPRRVQDGAIESKKAKEDTKEEDGKPITFRMKTKCRIANNKCWKVDLSSNGSFSLIRCPNEVILI